MLEGLETPIKAMVAAVGIRAAIEACMGWSHFVRMDVPRVISGRGIKAVLARTYESLVEGRGREAMGETLPGH